MVTLTDTTVKIQLTNFDLQSSMRLIALCRERGINVLGSQTKVQKAVRQTRLLANIHTKISQSNETPTPKHNDNGGDDNPPITRARVEMLTVRASVTTIAQTVHEFYQEFMKENTIMTIDQNGHTLDLEGKQIEEIHAFLQHKKNR